MPVWDDSPRHERPQSAGSSIRAHHRSSKRRRGPEFRACRLRECRATCESTARRDARNPYCAREVTHPSVTRSLSREEDQEGKAHREPQLVI